MSDSTSGDLRSEVREAVLCHRMLSPGDRVLVAVSGGGDSVALLDLMLRMREELELELHVAHLNHGLRGQHSIEDADFVRKLAQAVDLPFHEGTVAIDPRDSSVEETAREARLGFLLDILNRTASTRIALGHTRSDQAETQLMRMLRGAGMRGLGGIRPVRDGIWVRPLLFVSRDRVRAYLRNRGLAWRTDETNEDLKFTRNRVRHDLIPVLTRYAPAIEKILSRSAQTMSEDEDWMENQALLAFRRSLVHLGERKIILDAETFFGYHISLQRRLIKKTLEQISPTLKRPGFETIERFLRSILKDGEGFGPEGLTVRKHRDLLIFSGATSPFRIPVRIPGITELRELGSQLKTRVRPVADLPGLRDSGSLLAWFDLEELPPKIFVRSRRPGDRITPLGMSGTKKVSDLLIDSRTPRSLRDEVPLVTAKGTVYWVVGHRTSRAARIQTRTSRVLELEYSGGCLALLRGESAQPTERG